VIDPRFPSCLRPLLQLAIVLLLSLGPTDAAADEPTVRLAVMAFDNAAPDPQWDPLGKGFQAMLTTDLGLLSGLALVERARLTDIEAEIGLATGGRVDPATAVKIGKLAGATHLVAGAFSVVGETMRIDARVFSVETGDIITTSQTQGEAAAFFELEKVLVKKLAAAVGRELAPKDRARISGIHTADLDAFVEFGRGVGLVDREDYDKARVALESAARIDPTFELASLTLSDLDRMVRESREHADAAATAEREARRLKRAADDQATSEVLEGMWAMARTGADPRDRLLATAVLYAIYAHPQHHPAWGVLHVLDPLEVELTAGQLARAYVDGIADIHPRLPLVPGAVVGPAFPGDAEQLDSWWAELRARNDRTHKLGLNELFKVHYLADPMLLDPLQKAELYERLLAVAESHPECLPSDRPDAFVKGHLAAGQLFSKALALDRATAHFLAVRQLTNESEHLEDAAEEMEKTRERLAVLEANRGDPLMRELLIMDGTHAASGSTEGEAREAAIRRLEVFRDWDQRTGANYAWKWLGEVASFELESTSTALIRAGDQRDRRRATGVRYLAWPRSYESRPTPALLMALGTRPRGDVELSFDLAFDRPEDFFHHRAKSVPVEARPSVAVLLGARDIGHSDRAASGWAVRIGADGAVDLGRLQDAQERSGDIGFERVDGGNVGRLKATQRVKVELRGQALVVRVGAKTVKLTLPEAPDGFAGLWFAGEGFARVDDLILR
jgi:TolB-like protein